MARDLFHQEVTECLIARRMCKTSGSTDPTDLASFGEEEDDRKKHVGWWEAELNENERRDFPPGPEKKCDRYRTGAPVEEGGGKLFFFGERERLNSLPFKSVTMPPHAKCSHAANPAWGPLPLPNCEECLRPTHARIAAVEAKEAPQEGNGR